MMKRRHLFLDLREVTRLERLHRRMHQAERHPENPVLCCEHLWEDRVSLYGTVIWDPAEEVFSMWYLTGPAREGFVQVRGRRALGNITLLGYATSEDGVHWEKPVLGQLDYEGSRENNLIDVGRTNCEGFAVLYDEGDPDPERRYKGFYWEHGGIDTFREWEGGRLIWGEGEGDGMWMSFSADGVRWTNCPENPVIPLGSDTTQSLVWDPHLQKYVVFGRMGAGGRRVGRAESADGVHFSAPELVLDRQTFLPLGEPGSWEDGMARISQCFVVRDEQIYLYYGGVQGAHTGRKFKEVRRTHRPELGLATIRRDGFVSVEAGEEEGLLLTKPLAVEGKELHVNADVRGQLIAEMTDGQGIPLPGYTAHPVSKDRTDAVVRFDRPLAALAGREARLRFRLREANLYSYWFV